MSRTTHRLNWKAGPGFVVFLFGATTGILLIRFALGFEGGSSPGWASQFVGRFWPVIAAIGYGYGLWILGVYIAGPAVVDDYGVINPFSLLRGRRLAWSDMDKVRIVMVGGRQVGTVYFHTKQGRKKVLRLGLFKDHRAVVDAVVAAAPVEVEMIES